MTNKEANDILDIHDYCKESIPNIEIKSINIDYGIKQVYVKAIKCKAVQTIEIKCTLDCKEEV